VKIGIIVRSDNTGLGNQTLELTKMLNPHRVLLIDSSPFNGNTQYPERYSGYSVINSFGFPSDEIVSDFLEGLDIVFSCEVFYSDQLINMAKSKGIKTVLQYNYELFPNIVYRELPLADVLIAPSQWNIEKVERLFKHRSKIVFLPPPTNSELFQEASKNNLSKTHNKILHIAGKRAAKDRNGTDLVIQMLKNSRADYQLVIKSQTEINVGLRDSRLVVEIGNTENREDMYSGFDGMLLPRRYAGLCLPMNEALMSALPVFMTDISPNNLILPKEWMFKAVSLGLLSSKTKVELYSAAPNTIAMYIDSYVNSSDKIDKKTMALNLGQERFSTNSLKEKYLELLNSL
jgi:glycosyltransferase involved in cell wall biosynthesis